MDGERRLAIVETLTVSGGTPVAAPQPAARWQVGNHQDSATLELDAGAALVSYEEYQPWGTSCFQAGPNGAETSRKRWRHLGSERDEESGFVAHGARAYAPWLGRWTSCDPQGLADGLGLYTYAHDNPLTLSDRSGLQAVPDNPNANTPPQLPPRKTVEDVQREHAPWTNWRGPPPGTRGREPARDPDWSLDPAGGEAAKAKPRPWFTPVPTQDLPVPALDMRHQVFPDPPPGPRRDEPPTPAPRPESVPSPVNQDPGPPTDANDPTRAGEFKRRTQLPPVTPPTPGGALPAAVLTQKLPPPLVDKYKFESIAAPLEPLLKYAAFVGLLIGGIGMGYELGRTHPDPDGTNVAGQALGVAVGIAGGGGNKGLDEGVGKGWGMGLNYGLGPAPAPDQAPRLLPHGPDAGFTFKIPLWEDFRPAFVKKKK